MKYKITERVQENGTYLQTADLTVIFFLIYDKFIVNMKTLLHNLKIGACKGAIPKFA